MMKPALFALVSITLFAAGYFTGTVAPREAEAIDDIQPPKYPRREIDSSTGAGRFLPPSDFPERLAKAGHSEKDSLIAAIDPAHLFSHIEQLIAEASPDGLDYKLKSAIESMLEESMKADSQGTLDWVLGIQHKGNRDYLFEELLDKKEGKAWVADHFDQTLAACKAAENPHNLLKELIGTTKDSSPLEAIRLSKELLRKADGEIDFPGGLAEKCAESGWETLFEYYKDSWLPESGSSGWSWGGDFPKDFDFAAFAAAWKAHEQGLNLPEEGRFYEPPEMLWRTWSETDPQAAYEFLTSDGSRTFGLGEFFTGYSKSASPEEFFETSAGIIASDRQSQDLVGRAVLSYLDDRPDALRLLTEQVAQGRAESRLVGELIEATANSEKRLADIGMPILEAMPADQRLEVIRNAHTRPMSDGQEYYHMGYYELDHLIPVLMGLGHNEAEIRATLAND